MAANTKRKSLGKKGRKQAVRRDATQQTISCEPPLGLTRLKPNAGGAEANKISIIIAMYRDHCNYWIGLSIKSIAISLQIKRGICRFNMAVPFFARGHRDHLLYMIAFG